MAARPRRRRPALVPRPRDPHDAGRNARARARAAPSSACARSPRPISATAFSRARIPRSRRPFRHRHAIPTSQIALADELRLLEYGQRLTRRARNVFAPPRRLDRRARCSTARCAAARRRSAARRAASSSGADADIVTLRADVRGGRKDATTRSMCGFFAAARRSTASIARGRKVVSDGEHFAGAPIRDRFRAAMHQLRRLSGENRLTAFDRFDLSRQIGVRSAPSPPAKAARNRDGETAMMKRGLFATVIGVALAAALSGSAYADDVLAKVKAAGTMKVGTETEFAPFDYIDAGAHVGLNVDLFEEIGKELGRQDRMGDAAVGRRPARPRGGQVRHGRRSCDDHQGAHGALPLLAADRGGDRRADEAQGRQIGDEAGGHRRQDRRRGQGDLAARPAQGLSATPCRARSRRRNMSASTKPMPISPPAASWPSAIRCPTSPSSPSSGRTRSRSSCRPSASRPISASSAARTPITPSLTTPSRRRMLKIKADGRMAKIAAEVVRHHLRHARFRADAQLLTPR